MTDGRPRAGDQSALGRRARLVLAGALLIVAAAGARAALHPGGWDDGPWHRDGIGLGVALEAVLLALLVAVQVRRRRFPSAALPAAGLRDALRVLLLIGVVAIPVLIAINEVAKVKPHGTRPVHAPRIALPTRTARAHLTPGHAGGAAADAILYVLLVLAVVAAVAVCVLLLRRRISLHRPDEVVDEGEPAEPEQLRRAVDAGQAALREVDDARQAIIACYLAMEHSLASAGAERGAAETPDELLVRAVAGGLVEQRPAGRLTALFYEARFSSHPLPPAARDEARRTLDALAAGLRAALAGRVERAEQG